ncbi:MAG TPA: 4Fe-4S ferredoxin, partial [Anaeromyxobacteraceae bacterium]
MSVKVRLPALEDWKAQVKCQVGCPVLTDAGRYVQLIAEGRDEEAYLVARAPNPFASVCGRVCAAPCEDACRRGSVDAPISIRALKRTVTEKFGVE